MLPRSSSWIKGVGKGRKEGEWGKGKGEGMEKGGRAGEEGR